MTLAPVHLEDDHVLLEPLHADHAPALEAAAADGELWKLWFTSAPPPGTASDYVAAALAGQATGRMLAFAVRGLAERIARLEAELAPATAGIPSRLILDPAGPIPRVTPLKKPREPHQRMPAYLPQGAGG